MHDDDAMDRLLRDALAAEAPQLSPAFDARVMRGVRLRRLTPVGRVVIGVYAVVATSTAAWLMRDLDLKWIVAAMAISALVAAGASAYGRRLAVGP
jgi:hypothetical protein